MSTSTRSIARQLLVPGVALLLVGLLLQFLIPALLGEQANELLARVPWPVFTLVSFLGTVALMVGSTLLAGVFVARVVIGHLVTQTTSRDVTIRFDDEV